MKDIASLSGTSLGTVDRALNGKPGISNETRSRVLSVAKSLNYKPNRLGQALVHRNRDLSLGVIIEPVSNPFFNDIKRGVEQMSDTLSEEGISTHIYCMNTHREGEMLELLEQFREKGVAGIALNAINSSLVQEKIHQMRSEGIKIVTCNTDVDGGDRDCFVGFCHEKSGRVAAELLSKFNHGHGSFLAVIGYKYILAHMQRLTGFRAKISEEFPDIDIADVIEVEENNELAMKKTLSALDEHPEINGIFVTSYGIRGVVEAVKLRGRAKDISIICYDKSPAVREYMRDGIIDALIYQKPVEQGRTALRILSEIVNGTHAADKTEYITNVDIRLYENLDADGDMTL
ncbi:MAG: LacI family DNA-binding transcriptional regulator [Oscillospiraceae bacterium]